MADFALSDPERHVQPSFIKLLFLLIFVALIGRDAENRKPNRTPRGPATAAISAQPLTARHPIVRLWALRSREPRFGGLSALAWSDGGLLAVTDSGAAIRWRAHGGTGRFTDLPDGPGLPQWKIHRDAEALTRDSSGRGWWVAFEQYHSLYLFDSTLQRMVGSREIGLRTWWRNWGIEATVAIDQGLLLLPENGGQAILWTARGERRVPLVSPGQIADAARLADGRIIVALRQLRPWGMTSRLGWLIRSVKGYRVEPWVTLKLGRWDNVEGLAAQPMPGGRTRLWFVTDSDYRRRTLLGFVDIGPRRPSPGRPAE